MSETQDLKSVYKPSDFVNQVYEIQFNRLLAWRQRYSSEEYPYKVALNTVYQLLTCERMWDRMMQFFDRTARFRGFNEAYRTMQTLSGSEATQFIHSTLETDFERINKISILDMNQVRELVRVSREVKDNNAVKDLERIYLYYTGAVELVYGWVALGLTGMDIQQSVAELTGILIGGDYTNMDIAITNFGTIIDTCYAPIGEPWFKQ